MSNNIVFIRENLCVAIVGYLCYNYDMKEVQVMAKTDTIHMRVAPEVKSEADSILSRLGISTTDAINMFLNQVILRGGLPFEVRLPTARSETLALIERIENGTADMLGPFKTFEDFKKSLEDCDDDDEI